MIMISVPEIRGLFVVRIHHCFSSLDLTFFLSFFLLLSFALFCLVDSTSRFRSRSTGNACIYLLTMPPHSFLFRNRPHRSAQHSNHQLPPQPNMILHKLVFSIFQEACFQFCVKSLVIFELLVVVRIETLVCFASGKSLVVASVIGTNDLAVGAN